eukprot:976715_1
MVFIRFHFLSFFFLFKVVHLLSVMSTQRARGLHWCTLYLLFSLSIYAISAQSFSWTDYSDYNCDILSSAFDVQYELTLDECKEYCLHTATSGAVDCRGVSWYQYLKQDVDNDPMRCYLLGKFCDLQSFHSSPTVTSFWSQNMTERSQCIDYPPLWEDNYADDCDDYSLYSFCENAFNQTDKAFILEHSDPIYNLNAFQTCCDCEGSMFAFQSDRDTLFIEPLWKPPHINDISTNTICQTYNKYTNIADLKSKWDMNAFLGICDYFMQKVKSKYGLIYSLSSNINENLQSEDYRTLQAFDCIRNSVFTVENTTFYLCDQFDLVHYPYVIDLSSQNVYLNGHFIDIDDIMQNVQSDLDAKIHQSECSISSMIQDNSNSNIMATLLCQYHTTSPTHYPSKNPTNYPSKNPTLIPTNYPSKNLIHYPSKNPTNDPAINPTVTPTKFPSSEPTVIPTQSQTLTTTKSPTFSPVDTRLGVCSELIENRLSINHFWYPIVGVWKGNLYIFTGSVYEKKTMYIGTIAVQPTDVNPLSIVSYSHDQCTPKMDDVAYRDTQPLSCGGSENCFTQTTRYLFMTPSAEDAYGFWLFIYDMLEKKFISPTCYEYHTTYSTFGSCLSNNNSHIFISGGDSYNMVSYNGDIPFLQIYNTQTDDWNQGNSMNIARFGHGCSMVLGYKYLYVFGGADADQSNTESIERYTLQKDEWTFVSNVTLPQNSGSGYVAYLNAHDGNIHVISKKKRAELMYVFCTDSETFCERTEYGNVDNGAITQYHYTADTTFVLNIQRPAMIACKLSSNGIPYVQPDYVSTYFETCNDRYKWTYDCVEDGQKTHLIVISCILTILDVVSLY